MEHYGSIQSFRIRKPPQTELETLSSSRTCIILLFPVILSILTVVIDSNSSIHTKEFDIFDDRCPYYLDCLSRPGYLFLNFNKPPIVLSFIKMAAILEPSGLSTNISFLNESNNLITNQNVMLYFHTKIISRDLNHHTQALVYEKYKSYNETKIIISQNRMHMIPLLDWSFDQPSLTGNKNFLSVNISFSQNVIKNNIIFPKVVLKTQSRDYLLFKCISMITLSIFTIFASIYFFIRTILYVNRSRQKLQKKFTLRMIIAEQIYTMILLFFLLLWQGAPYAISLLLIFYQTAHNALSDKLLFAVGVMRDIGQQGIYLIFLILADGLHCSDTSFHQSLQLNDTSSGNDVLLNPASTSYSRGSQRTGAPEWTYDKNKRDSFTYSSNSRNTSSRYIFSGNKQSKSSTTSILTKGIYNQINDLNSSSATRLPAHHPSSPFVIDFLVWKIALFLTACLLVIVKRSLNFPYYFHYPWGESSKDQLLVMNAFAVASLLRVIISLVWVILFLVAMSRTARQLRKDRYMTSRFRQMAWRLLMNQVSLGITIIGVTYAIQLYHIIVLITTDGQHMQFYDIWDASIRLLSERFVSWAGEDTQVGELFYVSVVCYTITYVFSVPSISISTSNHSSEYAGTTHAFVALESDLDVFVEKDASNKCSIEMIPLSSDNISTTNRNLSRTSSKSSHISTEYHNNYHHQAASPFCLETSCFLLECTWQSYFPPEGISMYNPKDPLPNLLGTAVAANMDIKRLGLTLTKYFCDRVTDTWGYVAAKKGRIVVCFRGTVGFMNITTDLKLTQTTLPNLKLSDSELLELLCLLKGSNRDRDEMLSNTDLFTISSLLQTMSDITEENFNSHINNEPATPNIKSPTSTKYENAASKNEPGKNNDSSCCKSLLSKLPIAKQVLPRVHAGFWESYSTVRKEMMMAVTEAICDHYSTSYITEKKNGTKEKLEICVCGHSLGGAIAVLAALEISSNLKKLSKIAAVAAAHHSNLSSDLTSSTQISDMILPSLSLYTFGTPRVGNPIFARLMNKSIATYYRIEVDGDFFVSIPKFFGTYRHAGIPVLVDSEKSGCLIVKPTVVEHHFFRQSGNSAACHALERYRDCLEACFESDELAIYMSKEYEATRTSATTTTTSTRAAVKGISSFTSMSQLNQTSHVRIYTPPYEKKKTITLPEWLITSR